MHFYIQWHKDNRFTDRLPILFQKMLNFDIGIFKCQLHGKHILGDKRLVVQLFSSTIANEDFPLELHVKLIADYYTFGSRIQ